MINKKWMAFWVGLLWSLGCQASCTGGSTMFTLISDPVSNLNAARDAPVGSLLWETGWKGTATSAISCTGTTATLRYYWHPSNLPPGPCVSMPAAGGVVCPTNLAGIGVQLQWAPTGNPATATLTLEPTTQQWVRAQSGTTAYTLYALFRVRLFKTGPVSPGTLQLKNNVVGFGNYVGTTGGANLNLQIPAASITPRACTLVNANQVVVLPPRSTGDFSGGAQGPVGGTAGATPFSIQLNCDANLAVSFRLDGPEVAGATGVLANATGAGRATGVGVQVLRSGSPLALATVHFHANSGGSGGLVSVPMEARYYKTAPTVTPGTVSATATLTMTYQ